MTKILVALVLLLPLAACSSPSDEGGALVARPRTTLEADDDQGAKKEEKDAKKKARKGDQGSARRDQKRGGRKGGDDGAAEGDAPVASDDEDRSSGGAGAARTRPPAAGTYSYAQEGWEEMCQAGACDRSDLPAQQQVAVSHQSGDGSAFRTTTRNAGAREQTISYSLGSDRLVISRIANDFEYGAFRTRNEIVPDPPIVTARLPFRVGSAWNGEWKDRGGEIDGSYGFRVTGRDSFGDRKVFVVQMTMSFRGTYRGSTELKLWVDPRNVTIVASKGRTEITGDFGTYRTKGTTSLTGAP